MPSCVPLKPPRQAEGPAPHVRGPKACAYLTANAKSELPAATVTYCLPLTEYVIGPLLICPPSAIFQRRSPLRASSARKYPSLPPLNNTSDAVVSTPAQVMSFILNSHFFVSPCGSSARMTP